MRALPIVSALFPLAALAEDREALPSWLRSGITRHASEIHVVALEDGARILEIRLLRRAIHRSFTYETRITGQDARLHELIAEVERRHSDAGTSGEDAGLRAAHGLSLPLRGVRSLGRRAACRRPG